MPPIIRLATTDDLDDLTLLYRDFHDFYARLVPSRLLPYVTWTVQDQAELERRLLTLLEQDDAAVWAAQAGGQVVGMAEVYFVAPQPAPLTGRSRGHLQSLYVEEAWRRRGVGRLLVAAAEEWARSRGAVELDLDIWEVGAGPLAFYEELGYHTLRRTLVRRLVYPQPAAIHSWN
jgi:ribosomal protein S18 acetylase RimI-like enzyme